MAQGEAEHGCAQGEDVASTWPRGVEPSVPRQRAAEPPAPGQPESTTGGCRSVLPGWAGAHRHGPVRPAHRSLRRERPPRRWC
ncbi:hypothetical protein SAMN05443287_10966 [Micromonospora phaseoli]|uniref:Uncharacterized protein n=1 Tax=Micromonospora phaseoli TaxID=1144548 RepID=A0A1H7CDD7_9ACTN|nr:hypothetical protein [Micromonospora phaseoli]PZV97922.1 hypothetical protein CLV64_105188 [Micromonospora phaseoli]GIJ78589.1 hypothetical protein Xph01_30210 [Micromonospora phaseoli]SEJ87284.1 hypothetical protein SAMN05443287_10966 [Micromonospora phaseoli]